MNLKLLSGNLRSNDEREQVSLEIKSLLTKNLLHKTKSAVFYSRKREARRKVLETQVGTMDFQKNLPVTNIRTNEVYYEYKCVFLVWVKL